MKQTKICLNAMVANEANTILRMLNSVVNYIDYWVIQDNGSTDGTQDIIRNFFEEKGIPGFLYEIPWEYPGYNRDHTLQTCLKAEHNCDWILRMDADEQLKVDDDFDWSILNDTSIDSWNITAEAGSSFYFRTWLWNAKLPWFFQHDKRHETIHLPQVGENFQRIALPKSFRQIITNDGQTWFKPMKFLTDALELELEKVPSNKILDDDYHLFYIGKSYSDSYSNPSEFPFGIDHAREYARRAIFYLEMYVERQHNFKTRQHSQNEDDMSFYAMMLIGEAYRFLGEHDKQLFYHRKASSFSPMRNEHYLKMAEYYNSISQWENMLEVTSMMIQPERINPFPTRSFLIENIAYVDTSWYPMYLHMIALKNCGFEYVDVILYLNLRSDLPKNIKKEININNKSGAIFANV
jgi:glycosyltransferase involved in cell wall biosynthesis